MNRNTWMRWGFIFLLMMGLLLVLFLRWGDVKKMTVPIIPLTSTTGVAPSIAGWVYPGDPACSAMQEIADGRHIDVLKPQYFTLSDAGTLVQGSPTVCNGPSAANIALVKRYSQQQFVTISGTIAGISALARSAPLASTCTTMLLAFLGGNGFTGVEWDIEDVSSWSQVQYNAYKAFIAAQAIALHAHGFQMMIDGPAITNATYQGYYPVWKYEDFQALPIDKLVIMCYDFQNDQGNGTPVGSLTDIAGCCQWMKARISDHTRIVIGINSYGYSGLTGGYTATAKTVQQIRQYPGYTTAIRDPLSGELLWENAGISYNYSDRTTLDEKLQVVLSNGLSQVSVWHLGGGNAWFSPSGTPPIKPPVTPPPPIPPAPNSSPFTEAQYPGFPKWYAAHFDKQGNFLG